MPWEVRKKGDKYCVVKKGTNETVHCHDSREKAVAQLRALYANTSEGKNVPEELVSFGGEIKSLDEKGPGWIGGYLVLFGDENTPDLTGDYFTKETDFDSPVLKNGTLEVKSTVYYSHGLDGMLGHKKLGEKKAELKADNVGIWLETQLNIRDKYEKAIFKMAKAGKLGLSSGTATHLVQREEKKDGVFHVKHWPLGLDASITPKPAEFRTSVIAIKDLPAEELYLDLDCLEMDDEEIKETEEQETEELIKFPDISEVKAVYLGKYVEQDMTLSALRALNDALMYNCIYRCLRGYDYDDNGTRIELTATQRQEKINGALKEFGEIAGKVINFYMSLPTVMREKAAEEMKQLWPCASAKQTFAERAHSTLVEVEQFAESVKEIVALRASKGTKLSVTGRESTKALIEHLENIRLDLKQVLEMEAPAASDGEGKKETDRLRSQFLRLESGLQQTVR